MAINFEVPSYLEPPSQAQQAQLNQTEDAARERAGNMLRKQVGLARMQQEAAQLSANGVDTLTARKTALFNNAHLLFADNPGALVTLNNHEEANTVKERANAQLATYRQALVQRGEEALAQKERIATMAAEQREQGLLSKETERQAFAERDQVRLQLEAAKVAASAELGASRMEQGKTKLDLAASNLDLQRERLANARNKLSPAAQEGVDLAHFRTMSSDLETALNDPRANFDAGQRKSLEAELAKSQTVTQSMEARRGEEEVNVTTPGGETVQIRKGPAKAGKAAGDLTVGEQTRLGEDLQSSANALRSLGQLSQQINSGTVGAVPALKSALFDTALSQLDPSFADPARIATRARIGVTTQQILGELNRSGRFSNIELKRIEENMPSKGLLESPENAQTLLTVMRQTLAEKGARAAVALKRPVAPEIITTLADLDDATLARDVKDGFLDFGAAQQARLFRRQRGVPPR